MKYYVNFKWLLISIIVVLYLLPLDVAMAGLPSFRTSVKVINRAIQANIKKIVKPKLIINSRYASAMIAVVFSECGEWIATAGENGSVQLWNVKTGQKVMDLTDCSSPIISLIFSMDSNYLFTGSKNGTISQWDVNTGKKIRAFLNHSGAVYSMSLIQGERILSAGADGIIRLWNINSGELLQSFTDNGGAVHSIAVNDDNSKVVGGYNDGKMRVWDIKSGQILLILDGSDNPIYAIDVSSDNVVAAGLENGEVQLWSLVTGKKFMTEKRHDGAIRALAISYDSVFLVTGGDDKIISVSLLGGKKICNLTGHNDTINAISFSRENDFLLTAGSDKTTRVWSIESEKELARLIATRSGWAVISPDGFFDGTLDGDLEDRLDAVQWSAENRTFGIDGFMEKYYKPALLGRLLVKQPIKKDKNIQVISDEFILPPIIKISVQDLFPVKKVFVLVETTDQRGGVDKIRLYHNGKITDDTNAITKIKKDGDKVQKIKVYEVDLINGQNTLKTVGLSDARIESETVQTAIEQIQKKKIQKPATLHIVTVGINEYENPYLDLQFVVHEAKSVSKQFAKSHSKTFNNVIIYELYNKEATKAKIDATLELLLDIPYQDTILINLSGHGEVIDEQWYFIPYDLYDPLEPNKLKVKGISSNALESLVAKINARRIFLLMDSCKSGAALSAFGEFDAHKPFALLSRATGVHVGAAATGTQVASELPNIKHGVFTYTLLEAVNGAADNKPANGDITVNEILSYIKHSVPEIIKKYGTSDTSPQFPVISSRGMDFKIVETKY